MAYTRETSERSPCLHQPTNSSRTHSRICEEGRLFILEHIAPRVAFARGHFAFVFLRRLPILARLANARANTSSHSTASAPKKSFGVRQPSCRFSPSTSTTQLPPPSSFRAKQADAFSSSLAPANRSACAERNLPSSFFPNSFQSLTSPLAFAPQIAYRRNRRQFHESRTPPSNHSRSR